ncbi:peptidoglycan-binding protein [Streptomyces hawaiiensis]|uniref:peptidoglycan-binding protein n=1 Tax=Streptomyces hawaiiensis TaxID=67305 RepID=UPI00365A9EB1
MEPPNGHPCPECGAPRQRDNTPACACTHRASEALRDARTAQAAAAEDFDPLRIRPYVEIDGGPSGADADEGQPSSPAAATTPPCPGEPVRASEAAPATPSPSVPPADSAEATPYASRTAAAATPSQTRPGVPGPPGADAAGRAQQPPEVSLPEHPHAEDPGPTPRGTPATSATPPHRNAPQSPTGTPRLPEAPHTQPPGPTAQGTPDSAAADISATAPHQGNPQSPAGTPRQPGTGPAKAPQGQGPAADSTTGRASAAGTGVSLPHGAGPRPGNAAQPPSPADATMPLRPVDPDATAVLPAAPATSVIPTPLAPAAAEPSVTDLRLFDGTVGAGRGTAATGEAGARRSGRRRRTLLIAAAGACVAVVAAAGYASGLFSYESPSRDTALPDDIRASVPDAPPSSAASTPPQGSASSAPPAPAAPRPSPSRTGSPSASPSPSAPSASASPSQSPSPSASQPSATATGPGQAAPDNGRQKAGPTVLRLGDRGPEVSELQLRLRQLYLYDDDTDGTFDDRLEEAVRTYQWSRGIQVDDLGVYDRETRAKLESETREP